MTASTRLRGRPGLLRVHAWIIVMAVVLTVASAWAMTRARPETYVATAEVSLGPEQTGGTALRPEMASERAIASSGSVTSLAATTLGVDPTVAHRGLAVSVLLESSILEIRYSAPTSAAADEGARAFAQGYVDYRNNVAGTHLARVVTWPDTPELAGTSRSVVLGVALLAGLLLGLAAAWSWDRLSDRVRSPEELTERSSLPVLGRIPRWSWRGRLAPPGPAEDAFAYLATRLGSLLTHRPTELTITVTSPRAGAGTSTVAFNTARALAAQGRTVVLVDADLRQPGPSEAPERAAGPGLLDLLAGACTVDSAVRPTRWPNLSVLPLGGTEGSVESAVQPDMIELVLGELGSSAIVIVDAAPLLEAAATLMLVDTSDALLLVGDLRAGRRRDVEEAAHLVEDARPAVAGWVANVPRRGAPAEIDEPGPGSSASAGTPIASAARSDRVAS